MRIQQRYKEPIEGLHIETGGSSSLEPHFGILVSPLANSIPDTHQPSNFKILFVFSIATFIGLFIGWFLTNSINNEKLKSAELNTNLAKLNLAKNQEQIDNFCRANSSLR